MMDETREPQEGYGHDPAQGNRRGTGTGGACAAGGERPRQCTGVAHQAVGAGAPGVFGRAQGGLGFGGVSGLSLSRDGADRSGPYRQSQGPEKAQSGRAGGDSRAPRGRQGTEYGDRTSGGEGKRGYGGVGEGGRGIHQ